jgi:hypothetical protein
VINNKSITLISLSTDKPKSSLQAIKHCAEIFPFFDEIKLLSNYEGQEENIKIHKVAVDSYTEYNRFIVEKLNTYINTDYCLIVQDDGYIVNPDLWKKEFLEYDYIGAPWPWHGVCGNGGFSLRSKKFLELSSQLSYEEDHHEYSCAPEDWFLCVKNRMYFLVNQIKFAPLDLAQTFSFETPMGFPNEGKYNSFGFHGKHNL